jgi:carbonic anhydrase
MVTVNIPEGLLVVAGSALASALVAGYIAYRAGGLQQTPSDERPQRQRRYSQEESLAGALQNVDPLYSSSGKLQDTPKIERRKALREEVLHHIPTRVPCQVPSMEDCVQNQESAKAELSALTPAMVLANLQQGNARFWMGVAQRPEMSAMERRAMIMQQFPKAAILGCSDSRVPIEIVFDQGLGDIFAIRVAGNAVGGQSVPASIEYAVNHLKVKLVVVLGHEGCGAVRAAMLPAEQIGAEPQALKKWLTYIRRGLITHEGLNQGWIRDMRARDREAVICNVREQVKTLAKDPGMAAKVADGSILIVGAFYEISSGMVDFISMDDAVAPYYGSGGKGGSGGGSQMPSRKLSDHFERTPSSTPTSTPAGLRRLSSEGVSPAVSPAVRAAQGLSPPSGGVFDGIDDDGSLPRAGGCLPCDSSAASGRS